MYVEARICCEDIPTKARGKASSLHSDWTQYGRSLLRHPIFFLPLLVPMLWLRFPSFDLRLYITVATTLLLHAGHKNEVFPLITNRFAVNLGKIFYPLYLAHWPIYSFARYHSDAVNNAVEYGIAVAISLALFSHYQLRKLYAQLSSATVKVLYLIMVSST
ncbi:hypothetical protein GCK32_018749, partial [Trichostrongylus colubriformis]